MSHTAVFYGSSDDLVEVDGTAPGCEEYNTEDATFVVMCGEQGAVHLRVQYDDVWSITVAPLDEDTPMPAVAMDADRYTARARVEGVVRVVRQHADDE
jgi:hypothetical protein